MANADARERLRQHFLNAEESDHPGKWDDLYRAGFIPWDKGLPSAPLAEALARRDLISEPAVAVSGAGKQRKRALVPGCGKGYDVLLLAAFGYDAYGLETSELALKGAKETEEKHGGDEVYRVRDESVGKGKVTWIAGDFFKDDWAKSLGEGFDGTFDVLFDYTFLSALPPTLRAPWSRRYSQLLAPTGRLICLEFPTYKPINSGGPPWALPPTVYMAHLPRPGKTLEYDDQGGIVEAKLGEPLSDGLVRIAHFQPQKTHADGYDADGNMTDWVGVWSHPIIES
ncbi:hypothetical protein V502_04135 [Pseudogymnoascus sp. VKM F-4520 (FW-2644)]|nr:hypothetical protein V502_04135 [Pseudogymnoascus sp. VKM F-4520 (FW-2644)]